MAPLVCYWETEELTQEKWDELVAYMKNRGLMRVPIPGIKTEVRETHWINDYKEFANDRQGRNVKNNSGDDLPEEV